MAATDILGKIGEKVGTEFNNLKVSLGNLYATQTSLGTVSNKADANETQVSLNASAITSLQNSSGNYATKVSLGAVKTSINAIYSGTTTLAHLRASEGTFDNLTVSGTTTTLNTTTVSVEDNIIEVNLKSDGAETAQTGGIEVNRGLGEDKAKLIWDDALGAWKLLKGTGATKLYYSNHFANLADLPTAATYHGMFAHVHATGRGYYAHGGNWVELLDKNAGQTLTGDLLFGAGKAVKVANGSGITINNVSLGNYSSFETNFNDNK